VRPIQIESRERYREVVRSVT